MRTGTRAARLAAAAGVLAVAGGLMVQAGTASAAPPQNTVYTAVASWTPTSTDPGGPNVSLQVTEESGPTNSLLFFFVNENYCVGDTAVFLSYFEEGLQTELFAVAHNLNGAILGAPDIEGTYTEQTAPECNTDGSDLTTVFSTTARVSMAGRWTATGPATTTFPGNVVRPAVATIAMTGPAALGLSSLGAPSFAQLSAYTS